MRTIKEMERDINEFKATAYENHEKIAALQLEILHKLMGDLGNISWNLKQIAEKLQ